MLEVFRRLGSIQFDPLAIAGRTHDLVLHARVADYDPAWCDSLYERREIFEAYNKGLSFVPASEFPWFRGTWSRHGARVLAENAEVAERVLERIRAEGPLSALDFERARGTTTDWFGLPTNTVKAVLEAYSVTGVLGLARRDGNRRYYDLLERLLPADILARDVPLAEQLRHKLLSRYRAHGLLGVSGANDVFGGIGTAKPDPRIPESPGRNALREELVERGELVPVEVEGVTGKRFVLREEVAHLEAPPQPPPSVAFLPPFDALVWDRRLLGSSSPSTTSGSSSSHQPSGVGAGTCCRSSSGTASSAGSSRASTGRSRGWRSSTSGGRRGSRRAVPTGSSRRCVTRSAPTCASQAQRTWSGRRTSQRRNGSSASRPEEAAKARSRSVRSNAPPCVASTCSTGSSSSGRSPAAISSRVTPGGSHLSLISRPSPKSTSVSPEITARGPRPRARCRSPCARRTRRRRTAAGRRTSTGAPRLCSRGAARRHRGCRRRPARR